MIKHYLKPARVMVIFLCIVATQALAQRTITGSVTSGDDGSKLPGVTVLEKGTGNGTVTDAQGAFTILVKGSSSLLFSFVGYETQEVSVGNQTTVSVTLNADITKLSELVVVGYGSVKKSDATGSVSVVDARVFNKGVVTSPQELLMGKVAGVSVTTNSGAPGNSSTIRIRGGSSLSASNDPLVVIDGVPISNENLGGSPNILSTLNPNDIESFTVLKDASATAIYGLRASNGVIIITTKRGGKDFKLSYSVTATAYTAPRKVKVYSGDEYRALINDQYAGNNTVLNLLGTENTDWQKQIYKKAAFGKDHNITASGTAFRTPYRVSFGYNDTDGILKTYNFQRSTLSLGVDPRFFNDKLKVNINVKGMYNNNNFAEQGAIGSAIAYDPTKPVYNGNTAFRNYTTWTLGGPADINGTPINLATANPVAQLALTDNTSTVKRSIGNMKLEYEIPFIPNLRATLNVGYDYTDTKGHNNVVDMTQWAYSPTVAGGRLNPSSSVMKNQLLDFYGNYQRDLKSISSKIDVTGGYSWSHFYSAGGDSTMDAAGTGATRVNVYKSEYYLISFFGRGTYSFKDKYLVTATVRDEATSRFAKDIRWGLFPSVAVGWKLKQEAFLQRFTVLSELKLRAGYGQTGQQDISGNNYPYIATFTKSDIASRYRFGNTFINTLRPDPYNALIKWETSTTWNAGFDYGFLQNKITGSLDVYTKTSNNLISYIAPSAGANYGNSVISNVGSIENKGVELNISSEVISTDDIQWVVGYNITYNRNRITKLNQNDDKDAYLGVGNIGGTTSGTIQAQKPGYARNSYLVYQQVYDINHKPVEDAYVDRNGDGVINTSDMYIYKQPNATVYMGISSRLNVKNWDFNFSGRASLGNYVYNNVAANSTYQGLYSSLGYLSNASKLADDTKFKSALNTRFSDYYIENGSFFRLDNVNLGYTFKNLIRKEKLNIRIGGGVQNVFVITKYTGIDPEVSGGLDNNFFPRTRSFFFSLNAQF